MIGFGVGGGQALSAVASGFIKADAVVAVCPVGHQAERVAGAMRAPTLVVAAGEASAEVGGYCGMGCCLPASCLLACLLNCWLAWCDEGRRELPACLPACLSCLSCVPCLPSRPASSIPANPPPPKLLSRSTLPSPPPSPPCHSLTKINQSINHPLPLTPLP